jgi:hypothetical protein
MKETYNFEPSPGYFNQMASIIFEQNKAVGWWDDPDRCKLTILQLVNTEIAEATEGERKNLMDDKLPHRRMGEVELADALIRILDFAGRYNIKFENVLDNSFGDIAMEISMLPTIGARHLVCTALVCNFSTFFLDEYFEKLETCEVNSELSHFYSLIIIGLCQTAKTQDYDIIAAMSEKLEFNKTREDHKRENRALENGKKF